MSDSSPRVSIQRKIVGAIVSAGIAPLIVVVISYIIGSAFLKISPTTAIIVALFFGYGAVGLICLSYVLWIHRQIILPIRLLSEGVEFIRRGDLNLKLKISTNDEIEDLSISFNRMAFELSRNIHMLAESEEKYRELVTSMMEGIYQVDSQHRVSFFNKAAADTFGFRNPEEAIGRNMKDFYLDPLEAEYALSEVYNRGFARHRHWMRKTDGLEICVEISSNLIRAEDGNPLGIEGIFREVTQTVLLEQEAKDKAQRLAVIHEITNAVNSSLDTAVVYRTIAAEVQRLVAFDSAWITLLDESGMKFERSQIWPYVEGESESAHVATENIPHEAFKAYHFVCENEKPLIIDNLASEFVRAASDPGVDLPEDIHSCVFLPLKLKDEVVGTFELASRRKAAFASAEMDILEQIAGQVGVAVQNARLFESVDRSYHDVKKTQEKLAIANEELKSLDQMKTNLLSNVSHELRTPLVSIMGYTDMIYNGKAGEINDIQKEYLSISLRNIEKLVTLIENLLDFSRLHRGMDSMSFEHTDLVQVAESSIQVVRPQAEKEDVTMTLETPSADDGSRLAVEIEGDGGKLGQVFTNLLANAVKFNRKGGTITVKIDKREDREVRVTVTDTGIGIPREAQGKVFHRFYQYDASPTRKYGGTGIGLSIVHDIVRLHGGTVFVNSEVGKGSTFGFVLPLRRQRDKTGTDGKSLPELNLHRLIEIVATDQYLAHSIKTHLGRQGLNVMLVSSPEEGLELALKHSPDCIIIQESMPGSERITGSLDKQEKTTHIPLIMVSGKDGLADEDSTSGFIRMGNNDKVRYRMYRPLRRAALFNCINEAIGEGEPVGGIELVESDEDIEAPRRGRRILVVDDDREIVEFVDRVLSTEGYDVICADNGSEGLERVLDDEVGLVLLDIAMPDMDGLTVCRKMREDPRLAGLRIYMVTAKADASTLEEAARTGADGHIIKPFRTEHFVSEIRKIFSESETEMSA